MPTFIKADAQDIPGILALHRSNLLKNLTRDDRQDGFLAIEFSGQQFEALSKGLGIFVATLFFFRHKPTVNGKRIR